MVHCSLPETPTAITTTTKKTTDPSMVPSFLPLVFNDFTLSPLPHLLETRQTIQSCFTDKYEGGDRFVTFEDSRVTFIGGVCPTLKCETGGGGGELSEHLLRGASEKREDLHSYFYRVL